MRSSLAPLAIALLAATQPACSLLDTDFEGSVRLLFNVNDPDTVYQSVDMFNPNDNEDFAANRDRIRTGTIESMEFRFQQVMPDNRSSLVLGSADIRPAGSMDEWTEGVSAWEGVQVISNNTFFVDVPADKQQILTDLIFETEEGDPEALEVRIDGLADQGPVMFDIQVTLNMIFTAGL